VSERRAHSQPGEVPWPPGVPEGPLVVLFLSPDAAHGVAATLGEHSVYPNIVNCLRLYAAQLDPKSSASAGWWWASVAPLHPAWLKALLPPSLRALCSQGIAGIAAERERQRAKFSTEHDDGHKHAELAVAAAELAAHGTDVSFDDGDAWGLVRKHGKDRVRSLQVAGALIAAEIERIQRQTEPR
jgi:hypothetical protein